MVGEKIRSAIGFIERSRLMESPRDRRLVRPLLAELRDAAELAGNLERNLTVEGEKHEQTEA
jgi:hypothetical protein